MYALLFSFIISVSSISSANGQSNVNFLKGCMDTEDIDELNNAILSFENEYKRYYGKDLQSVSDELYKQYVQQVSNSEISSFFWTSDASISALDKMTDIGLFNRIWIRSSQVEIENNLPAIEMEEVIIGSPPPEEEDFDSFVINPKGTYAKCVLKNVRSPFLREYLKASFIIPDISPTIKSAGLLVAMEEAPYNSSILRTIVVIDLYYSMVVLIQKR